MMYSYKSKIVSNVHVVCRLIHRVLHKYFSLRFLVSGERHSVATSKNFWHFGELCKKLNSSWQESIKLFRTDCVLQAWQITRLSKGVKAAALVICIGCKFGYFRLNGFLIWAHRCCCVVCLAWQFARSIPCLPKLSLIAFARSMPQIFSEAHTSPSKLEFSLTWMVKKYSTVKQAKAYWQNFPSIRCGFVSNQCEMGDFIKTFSKVTNQLGIHCSYFVLNSFTCILYIMWTGD